MFCPNCGQQQPADTTKYCPRCGTLIAGLAEWLAAGGAPIAVREAPQPPAPARPSPRRRGMRRGGKLMFLSGVLLPFLIGMSIVAGDGGPLVISLLLFFIGFSLMLYARLFSDDTPGPAGAQGRPQMPGATPGALPPAADNPVNNFGRRGVRTAELARPPSVTEHTTRLLDDE